MLQITNSRIRRLASQILNTGATAYGKKGTIIKILANFLSVYML